MDHTLRRLSDATARIARHTMNLKLAGGIAATILVILAAGYWVRQPDPVPTQTSLQTPSEPAAGSLYGRVTTYDGTTYEGPLRWGGGEEAFWGHAFNGVKDENPWATYTPLGRQAENRRSIEILGFEIPLDDAPVDLTRPFMVRFGDIARIEAHGDRLQGALESKIEYDPTVRVTLKSGATFNLDRLAASDFDDGVRVWDGHRGIVDLGPRKIRTIELLPNPRPGDTPDPLHGTVHTRHGDFTGFLQWDREEAMGSDELVGLTAEGEVRMRFDAIRSIVRDVSGGSRVTLRDGHEVVLSDTPKVGPGNRGVYVDDPRYGRVLISWDVFQGVDFTPGGPGPRYDDFPPGRPLTGSVTTRDGRRLVGRLVYDLDESETTETLDAPGQGVDYTLPFGLVASIELPSTATERARVILQGGETLDLERSGDLGEGNAGLLIFGEDREHPAYVPWADVERVDLDRPSAMYPPLDVRDAERPGLGA